MAGVVAANGEPGTGDPRAELLVKEGWSAAEEAPCPGLSPGGFYEVSGGEDSAEFYQALTGETFTREGAWPEGLRTCREIPEPTDIEELQ